jgi:N-hydroxyarylamine O-acetyltransferase
MTNSDHMLDAYLARVRVDMPLPAGLAGLQTIHRAQAMTVPYEAIDVFAGCAVTQDIGAIQQKIILGHRGGWCYETNRLLAWALEALGFRVRLSMAAAYNQQMPENALGNHIVPIVTLNDGDWLCDLGLGDALRAPIPLREGQHHDGSLMFQLEKLHNGQWRFWNHRAGDPSNCVVDPGPADEDLIARKHAELLADPQSSFRQNFQVMQMGATDSTVIYGRVLRRTTPQGVTKALIAGPGEMESLLDAEFGLRGVEVGPLWPRILARHAVLFGHPDAAPAS